MTAVRRIVATWLATAYGGAEKSTLELCRTIRDKHGISATPIVWHYGDPFDFPEDGAAVHCYTADDYRETVAQALADEPQATVVISNHRTFQIDLPLADDGGVASAVVFRQTPMPNEAMRTLPSPSAPQLAYLRGHELDWNRLRGASALVGVSDFGAQGIARFAANHSGITRIFNGLTMPGGIGPVSPRPIRRFLIVSRLIDWKAIDFGLQAFSQLCARHPDVLLQIAGDGEEEPRLRQLAEALQVSDRVEFLGFVRNIREVYLNNDCLLHLSGIESFGRVVIEAALCGIPVVVPHTAGTGELVSNEHTGLTFDPNDLADCVRAIDRAYHLGTDEYSRLATAAQSQALAVFNPGRVAADYVALAESIVTQDGRAL